MSTGKKLDRSKPFGTVHGDEAVGCCFEQFGTYFNARGEEWTSPAVAEPAGAPSESALAAARAAGMKDAQKEMDAKIAAAVASALAQAKKADKPA